MSSEYGTCIYVHLDEWYFSLFRHKKRASKRRTFNSSPIFEISLRAALLNTLRYPYTLKKRLYLAQG